MTALHTALKGRHVQFRLRDVHLPDPAVIFRQLHGDDVIEGEVLDATESVIGGGVFLNSETRPQNRFFHARISRAGV